MRSPTLVPYGEQMVDLPDEEDEEIDWHRGEDDAYDRMRDEEMEECDG